MAEATYSQAMIKVIIGLGNPGGQYSKNRHNIGFKLVDFLAEQNGGQWRKTGNMELAEVKIAQEPFDSLGHLVYLVKPLTFMNKSGDVLPFFLKKGIKAEHCLVVHDELEKPFESATLKLGGSAKGHNGLRSIIDRIGPDFWRLRLGIGRPADKSEVATYVLSNFTQDEALRMDSIMQQAARLIVK